MNAVELNEMVKQRKQEEIKQREDGTSERAL